MYAKLTGEKGGIATLSIIDRDKPYSDNINNEMHKMEDTIKS